MKLENVVVKSLEVDNTVLGLMPGKHIVSKISPGTTLEAPPLKRRHRYAPN